MGTIAASTEHVGSLCKIMEPQNNKPSKSLKTIDLTEFSSQKFAKNLH